MTETVDGVRDPQRVSAEAERAYFRYPLDPTREEHEAVVDDEGYVRYPDDHDHHAGDPLHWGGTTIVSTLVIREECRYDDLNRDNELSCTNDSPCNLCEKRAMTAEDADEHY